MLAARSPSYSPRRIHATTPSQIPRRVPSVGVKITGHEEQVEKIDQKDNPGSSGLSPKQEVQMEFNGIKEIEERSPGVLRRCMEARGESLQSVAPDTVRAALYNLLNAPPHTPSPPAMAALAQAVRGQTCEHATIVDDEGNPWSEHILAFIDTFLVLYRPVTTTSIPLRLGQGRSGENDETDQKAFGALTATSLAPRVLILIPHAHHHTLRALWFALVYLSMAYVQSKRGVAVEFLLERVLEEWASREEKARSTGSQPWGRSIREIEVEGEWLRRARRVSVSRKELEGNGGMWLGTVWAEMKGMVQVPDLRRLSVTSGRASSPADLGQKPSGRSAGINPTITNTTSTERVPQTSESRGQPHDTAAPAASEPGRRRVSTKRDGGQDTHDGQSGDQMETFHSPIAMSGRQRVSLSPDEEQLGDRDDRHNHNADGSGANATIT